MAKVSINAAIQELSISKSNLYNKLRKLNIKSIKIGNRAYLLDSDIASVKRLIMKNSKPNVMVQKQEKSIFEILEQNRPIRPDPELGFSTKIIPKTLEKNDPITPEKHYIYPLEALKKQYSHQIAELKKDLKQKQVENQKLILECGKWQGIAQTLEDQNTKILASLNIDYKNHTEMTETSEKKEKESLFKKSVSYFNENF
jgi:hypothetical protein